MVLEDIVKGITGFSAWKHADKIKFLPGLFTHREAGTGLLRQTFARVTTASRLNAHLTSIHS
jgi:hypothetical protein